jgi:hypothetical protein
LVSNSTCTALHHGKLYYGGKHLAAGDSVPAEVGPAACGINGGVNDDGSGGGGACYTPVEPANEVSPPAARVVTCARVVYVPEPDYYNFPTVNAFGGAAAAAAGGGGVDSISYPFNRRQPDTGARAAGGDDPLDGTHVSAAAAAAVTVVATPDMPTLTRDYYDSDSSSAYPVGSTASTTSSDLPFSTSTSTTTTTSVGGGGGGDAPSPPPPSAPSPPLPPPPPPPVPAPLLRRVRLPGIKLTVGGCTT